MLLGIAFLSLAQRIAGRRLQWAQMLMTFLFSDNSTLIYETI